MPILDLIFPKSCVNCGAGGGYICDKCTAQFDPAANKCLGCGLYSVRGTTHTSCTRLSSLAGHRSLWKYSGAVRKAIHALKYRFASDLAGEIARLATLELKNGNVKYATLLPIPLHRKRQNWRGFNHAAEVGRLIAVELGWDYRDDVLVRIEAGRPQVGLKKEERLRNIRGKYAVNSSDLEKNGLIIIFDDVYTTGATIKEAAKALNRAGFKKVWGLTLAS